MALVASDLGSIESPNATDPTPNQLSLSLSLPFTQSGFFSLLFGVGAGSGFGLQDSIQSMKIIKHTNQNN